MPDCSGQYNERKRKIRDLKKMEIRIRFGGAGLADVPPSASLVWDAFFDLHQASTGKAKYTIRCLSAMDRDAYRGVIDEFFFTVYYRFYKENGFVNMSLHDPDILAHLNLPIGADDAAIKKRFRELALKYHPDTGGDAARFIILMEEYRKLIEKGR